MVNPDNVVNVYVDNADIFCLKCDNKIGIVSNDMFYLDKVTDNYYIFDMDMFIDDED